MLCGLPGSGKSKYAEKMASEYGFTVRSSDALRKELFGDENHQGDNAKLFDLIHRQIRQDLKAGKNVVYDATNISRKRRIGFLKQLENIDCGKYCVFIPTPYEVCLKNNKRRDRKIPVDVIQRMYKSIQPPHRRDGFDKVFVDFSVLRKDINAHKYVDKLCKIEHNNPHHKLTIGDHCKEALRYITKYSKDTKLKWATYLHDVGKPECKQYADSSGNPTKTAHFYGHENVSAYRAVELLRPYFDSTDDILDIVYLINNHMRLLYIEQLPQGNRMAAFERLERRVGGKFIKQLMLLREADEHASK